MKHPHPLRWQTLFEFDGDSDGLLYQGAQEFPPSAFPALLDALRQQTTAATRTAAADFAWTTFALPAKRRDDEAEHRIFKQPLPAYDTDVVVVECCIALCLIKKLLLRRGFTKQARAWLVRQIGARTRPAKAARALLAHYPEFTADVVSIDHTIALLEDELHEFDRDTVNWRPRSAVGRPGTNDAVEAVVQLLCTAGLAKDAAKTHAQAMVRRIVGRPPSRAAEGRMPRTAPNSQCMFARIVLEARKKWGTDDPVTIAYELKHGPHRKEYAAIDAAGLISPPPSEAHLRQLAAQK